MRPIKYILLFMALGLAACNKYDIQPEQAEGFIKFFFTGELTETAYDVKETADGGYVAIGTTSDDEGVRDLYLVKTDKYGNEESWSPVTIGGAYDDVGTSIQVVSDGYVILGYSKQTDTSEYDMYLVKTDLQGNVVWETWTNFPNDDRGSHLLLTSAGDFLAAGLRKNTYGYIDLLLWRFDAGGVSIGIPKPVTPDEDVNVLNAYLIEIEPYFVVCNTIQTSQKKQIVIIPFLKESLNFLAGKFCAESGDLEGNCIQELSDGNLLICGTVTNPGTGLTSIYLNKITPTFGTVPGWETAKTFPGESGVSLTGNAVRVLNDNSYAILGTRTETGNDDMILLLTDGNGTEVSRRIFGDDGFQQGISLELTGFDGGLILVGNNGSEDQSMISLVKTDASGKL